MQAIATPRPAPGPLPHFADILRSEFGLGLGAVIRSSAALATAFALINHRDA
jgi:hypothetical protein